MIFMFISLAWRGEERIHEFFIRNDLNKHLIWCAFVTHSLHLLFLHHSQAPKANLEEGREAMILQFQSAICELAAAQQVERHISWIIWYSFNAFLASSVTLTSPKPEIESFSELFGSWETMPSRVTWNKHRNGFFHEIFI